MLPKDEKFQTLSQIEVWSYKRSASDKKHIFWDKFASDTDERHGRLELQIKTSHDIQAQLDT